MSIFGKIAYHLGFGSDEIEEELQNEDVPQHALASHSQPSALHADAQPLEVDPDVREKIFSQVLSVFNASMPDFLSRSVDPKKQSHLLYEALDSGLQQYLSSLEGVARAKVDAEWQAERTKMQAEADALKKKAAELEERRALLHERQLSADRQKRALSERVHDLEDQVLKLEAEKEQYEIETKCMANKTKAVAVLEDEIAELQRLLQEKGNAAAPDPEIAKQNEELLQQLAEQKQAVEPLQQMIEEQKGGIEQLQVEVALQKSEVERQKAHVEQLKAELSAEKERAEAAQKEAEEAVKAKEELEANGGMDEATKQEVEEIKEQVAMFEQVKRKMDARIDKLKESLKASQKEAESLRLTLRNNLKDNTEQQRLLREEIASLKSNIAASDAGAYTANDIKPVAAEEVDDLVLGTDWLVATPAKDVSMRPEPENSDFGYQAPPKKQKAAELDTLPTLFD